MIGTQKYVLNHAGSILSFIKFSSQLTSTEDLVSVYKVLCLILKSKDAVTEELFARFHIKHHGEKEEREVPYLYRPWSHTHDQKKEA
jgi:hypothetical protein